MKNIILIALLATALTMGGFFLGYRHAMKRAMPETRIDTVFVKKPVASDSGIIRWDTIYISSPTQEGELKKGGVLNPFRPDSAHLVCEASKAEVPSVVLPITQKVYKDSSYTAWVSGYKPQLDSIEVYNKFTSNTVAKPLPKWSLGVGVGYGYGIQSRSLEPFIGITLTYRLWSK